MPRVRILNQDFDTPSRQCPVGTVIQLTCQGQVGSDKSKVRINVYIGYMEKDLSKSFSLALCVCDLKV